jgi:hypothetical protein
MGPCGPSSSLGELALLGAPIGFIGMIIGLILSIVFVRRAHNKEHVDDQHG